MIKKTQVLVPSQKYFCPVAAIELRPGVFFSLKKILYSITNLFKLCFHRNISAITHANIRYTINEVARKNFCLAENFEKTLY